MPSDSMPCRFGCALLTSALLASCTDAPTAYDTEPAPAALTVSAAVAGSCENPPHCNPGFAVAGVSFTANLSRSQVVPPIPSSAGSGTFTLNETETALTYEIRVLGVPNVTNAHFHNAVAGVSGGVVRALTGSVEAGVWVSSGTWSSEDATQPLTAEMVSLLKAGSLYVNIHTADYGGGEIRGQVLGGDGGFAATLDRAQVVPPIPEPGGTATFRLNAAHTRLTYEIRVVGVPNVSNSHFHRAPAGTSGGVVRALQGSFEGATWVSSGTWSSEEAAQPLTPELVADLLRGNLYVNIHTPDYGGGEIRGQVVR